MRALIFIALLHVLSTCARAALTKPTGCGSDVGCYSDCSDTCKFVVTWKENSESVEFTLDLTLETLGSDWIALGLSEDRQMGSDSVTECVMVESDVVVAKSYNPGEINSPLSNPTEGLSNTQSSTSDGVLSCSFTQTKTSSNSKIFDLNTDWYLLVAYGKASNGIKFQHNVDHLPSVTVNKADFQSTEDITGSAKAVLVKVHGALMMFAWIFCASLGVVLARHFKPMWPNSTMLGEKVWFTLHRICMGFAFLACLAAVVIIVVDVEAWSTLAGSTTWQKAHPYIGVVVTFFVILNPIMALFRPHPDSNRRYIFTWAHWFVGTVAQILSVMALVLGVTLARASAPFDLVWILIAWAVYQMIMELVLEVIDCCTADNRRRYYRDGTMKEPRGSLLKKILLTLHVLIITAFTVVCIVILVIN